MSLSEVKTLRRKKKLKKKHPCYCLLKKLKYICRNKTTKPCIKSKALTARNTKKTYSFQTGMYGELLTLKTTGTRIRTSSFNTYTKPLKRWWTLLNF